MVDMHIHTKYSDGDKTLEEVLKLCEEKKLDYISITDHNTCKVYNDKIIKDNKIYTGKIVVGAELNATFNNKNIEILAYNIKDIDIIENWCQKYFSEEILRQKQKNSRKRLLDICDEKGLIYDENAIKKDISLTDYPTIYIYEELIKHKENYEILGEYTESLSYFIRKGLSNPESDFYVDYNGDFKPMYKDVVDIIHKAGGLAFLAHPFVYRFDDTIGFIDELLNEAKLDGIECFHPSSEEDNKSSILVEYARKNNLYISGGSDFHGDKKLNNHIAIGNGTLNIPKEFIEEWIDKAGEK